MRQVRIGLVGTGFMAHAHAACYALDERVELVVIAAHTSDGGERFCRDYGVPRYVTRWQEIVSDKNVDLVDITAPNHLHAEIAVAAAEAGRAIIAEKPLATTSGDARRVISAVRENGVLGMYAENRLFAPAFERVREQLAAGELGAVKLFRINEMGSGPGHAGWFRDPEKAGGGALMDMGIHGIALSEWLIGSPITSVHAMRSPAAGAEETVITSARFASGVLGQLVCSWGIQGGLDIRAEIYGETGTVMVDHSKAVNGVQVYRAKNVDPDPTRPHQASTTGWSYTPVDELNVKGHSRELRHFVDCYLDKTPCRSTFDTGLRALTIAEAIYASAASGKEIRIEGADNHAVDK